MDKKRFQKGWDGNYHYETTYKSAMSKTASNDQAYFNYNPRENTNNLKEYNRNSGTCGLENFKGFQKGWDGNDRYEKTYTNAYDKTKWIENSNKKQSKNFSYKMKIIIVKPTGSTQSINVSEDDTVQELKDKISQKFGINWKQHDLRHGNFVLDDAYDGIRLWDMGVEEEGMVHITSHFRGTV